MKRITVDVDEKFGDCLSVTAVGCDKKRDNVINMVTANIDITKNNHIALNDGGRHVINNTKTINEYNQALKDLENRLKRDTKGLEGVQVSYIMKLINSMIK